MGQERGGCTLDSETVLLHHVSSWAISKIVQGFDARILRAKATAQAGLRG